MGFFSEQKGYPLVKLRTLERDIMRGSGRCLMSMITAAGVLLLAACGYTAPEQSPQSPILSSNPPAASTTLPQGGENSPSSEQSQSPAPTGGALKPNEFDANELQVGDQIVGLTVQSVERDADGPGSLLVEFEGTLTLQGTYHYYSAEQQGQENYRLYLTLDPQSIPFYPRVKSDNMEVEERIGIINSEEFKEILGEQGTSGTLEGLFSHFILYTIPHKPAEGSIQLDKIVAINKQ